MVCHRGGSNPLTLELAKYEADFAIDAGATADPYNESPWRYLVGILREQHRQQANPTLMREYEQKASQLRQVVTDADRDPDTCANMTSARIDLLEMIADKEALETVSFLSSRITRSSPSNTNTHLLIPFFFRLLNLQRTLPMSTIPSGRNIGCYELINCNKSLPTCRRD
jgi:hypothetical protein